MLSSVLFYACANIHNLFYAFVYDVKGNTHKNFFLVLLV